ncbi:hypothetical protein HK405_000766 [Cladochytrium tenue]|nr:hypothetical protein HK405_000766 [Cladochytrium tenue]
MDDRREVKMLKQRIEVLEKENAALKKSLFELSIRFNMLGHRAAPFSIDEMGELGGRGLPDPVSNAEIQTNSSRPSAVFINNGHPASLLSREAHGVAPTGTAVASFGLGVSVGGLASTALNGSPGLSPGPSQVGGLTFPGGPSHYGIAMQASGASVSSSTPPSGGSVTQSEAKAGRGQFKQRAEIKGHTGAVYAVAFSKCGRFLASGSFDKTVRIWDSSGNITRESHVLREHTINVSDLSWSADSTELLSGSYDQTCKAWNVETGQMLYSYSCEGLVQCVSFHPKDKNITYYGTTRNILGITDKRDRSAAITIRNDSMVNSLLPSVSDTIEEHDRKVALITGITGQDGSYLTELLLSKGYTVHGVIRRSSSFNTGRIEHLYRDQHQANPKMILHYGDLTDSTNLVKIVSEVQPTEIYNLGAQSHVKVSFDMAQYTADVDAVGTLRLLDAIRTCGLTNRVKFYQASTSELYGRVVEVPQSETTPFYPRSPYGQTFVTRKISRAVASIFLGRQDCVYLGNIDAKRDWGHARDYVEAMWLMLQQESPEDFVIATGETHTVREFVEKAFAVVGITIEWRGEAEDEIGICKESGKHLVQIGM